MEFKEFKEKVESWARVRGIYDESTEAHQQAKALEEIGEYLTAETDEERMDAIGDIAVCIVNAAKIKGEWVAIYDYTAGGCIGDVADLILSSRYKYSLSQLKAFTFGHGYKFEDCLEQAWNEIKGRKGMMIDGKYVKWENLTDEQREEFERRDPANTLIRQ